jgi:hypothetical protein
MSANALPQISNDTAIAAYARLTTARMALTAALDVAIQDRASLTLARQIRAALESANFAIGICERAMPEAPLPAA